MESGAYELVSGAYHPGAGVKELSLKSTLREYRSGEGFLWVHIVAHEFEPTRDLLSEAFEFHPLEVEDALSANERPALQVRDGNVFLVIPVISSTPDGETYAEAAFFVGKRTLVTLVDRKTALFDDWLSRWRNHPAETGPDPSEMLHALLDAIVDSYFPAIDIIDEQIDDFEERIFDSRTAKIEDALLLKRRLLEMRRRLSPVREILNMLLRKDSTVITRETIPYFQDVYDHILRLSENIDVQRDVLASVMDAHLSVVSNNLNNVMRKMTVIATLLMTASLVAGIYGMNFHVLPELEWAWGYPFALGLMVVLSGLEVWIFKRFGWL